MRLDVSNFMQIVITRVVPMYAQFRFILWVSGDDNTWTHKHVHVRVMVCFIAIHVCTYVYTHY